jgi:hypothetical protein
VVPQLSVGSTTFPFFINLYLYAYLSLFFVYLSAYYMDICFKSSKVAIPRSAQYEEIARGLENEQP